MYEPQEGDDMASKDNVRERIEALEQQMKAMGAHTRTVERRLRWWRGIACGLGLLGLVSLSLQSGTAADPQPKGMAERMATLEQKLSVVTFDRAANEVVISGANLRIVNGLGSTTTRNGLGNLIVGYNELRLPTACVPPPCINERTGSHNVVVGIAHNFSLWGGLVVGTSNTISSDFASVSGGANNTASGISASVSGGSNNTASGDYASVSGGDQNTASGDYASVSGGNLNTASGFTASVSGGDHNTASSFISAVSGGLLNTASGDRSSVSGGIANTASGDRSSVSGGNSRSAPATDNWAAGPLFADN